MDRRFPRVPGPGPAELDRLTDVVRGTLPHATSEGVVERIGRGRLRLIDATRLARAAASPTARDGDGRNMFLAGLRRAMQE